MDRTSEENRRAREPAPARAARDTTRALALLLRCRRVSPRRKCARPVRVRANADLAEDALFQDRATADGPPDGHPQTPRVLRCGADTDGEWAHRGATIQVQGASVHVRARDVVDAVTDPTCHQLETEIPGLVPQGRDILELPQVASASGPVVADSKLAELEPGKAAGAAQRELSIGRELAAEIRAAGEGQPQHVPPQRQRHTDTELRTLPVAVCSE